uniref:Uncharacterized protein n=1 Tax=Mycena chlorophos TaxID=658473 RepID=A0ABQ0L821_MYCCL|nr:predicted protein [Mycena chlorophos]
MPLLWLRRLRSDDDDDDILRSWPSDAYVRFSFEQDLKHPLELPDDVEPRERAEAAEPPPLSRDETNLFDTFPRIVFGGYRRYYQSNPDLLLAPHTPKRREKKPPKEDPWSWHSLNFTGKQSPQRSRRRRRRTSSTSTTTHTSTSSTLSTGNGGSPPPLREKPRIRRSVGGTPLVDKSYPWPQWLWPDSDPAPAHDKVCEASDEKGSEEKTVQ